MSKVEYEHTCPECGSVVVNAIKSTIWCNGDQTHPIKVMVCVELTKEET